jgi:putative methionine-R-sulfoxide reductase with GAF domain
VNVGDVTSDPRRLTALDTTRSEIIIPVLDEISGIPIVTLDVESELPNAFGSEAQAFLERCAVAIGVLFSRCEAGPATPVGEEEAKCHR